MDVSLRRKRLIEAGLAPLYSTWLWGHCRWLQPNQAFHFHLTYRAQGENENRASFHFISTSKLERLASRSEYIKDLFSCWLQGCDRPPAEVCLIDMYVKRRVTANSRFLSSFGRSPVFLCGLIINVHTETFASLFGEEHVIVCVREIQIEGWKEKSVPLYNKILKYINVL